MSDNTQIEWADATLNYVNGCSVYSPGCTNCYAMRLAGTRLRDHPSRAGLTQPSKAGPVWTGEVRAHEPALLQALKWKRPRRIFWNAHGDLFHDAVPDEWIDRLFAVCALTPQHTHLILTKRSARMRAYLSLRGEMQHAEVLARVHEAAHGFVIDRLASHHSLATERLYEGEGWPIPNVWLGVSVEDQARADERIPDLLATPAAVRWISAEPLLGPVDLTDVRGEGSVLDPECWGDCRCDSLYGYDAGCRRNFGDGTLTRKIDWIVAGGESGPGARPMHPDWARSLRDQCGAAGVPFLFKQWGEWAPVSEMGEQLLDDIYHPAPERQPDAIRRCKVEQCVLHGDGTRFGGIAMFVRPAFEQGSRAMTMFSVGKKRAGRLLDGVLHDGYPA